MCDAWCVFDELDWSAMMMAVVKLAMVALMCGQNVLLHCRHRKHRSGVFCVLMFALLWECSGCDIAMAPTFLLETFHISQPAIRH